MTQKQISDETLDDRLLTGAWAELQDLTSGSLKLAIDDLLAGVVLDSTTQALGFTAANTAEVEATTRAVRATMRPDTTNYPQVGWQIGRYAWTSSNYTYATGSQGVADFVINMFSWVNAPGIVCLKKVNAFLSNGVLGGTSPVRAGVCNMKLFRVYGLDACETSGGTSTDGGVPGNMGFPPGPQGSLGSASLGLGAPATIHAKTPAFGCSSMLTNQGPGQTRIEGGLLQDPTLTGARGYVDPNPVACIEGAIPQGGGQTVFMNQPLYDWHLAEQPLILVPGTGFVVTVSWPLIASGTATTMDMMGFCNYQWDEWTLTNPGDRK